MADAGPADRRPVPRDLLEGGSVEVAPALLNKLLAHGGRVGRIVEVEAYRGSEDPASHAFGGPTRRNATMFGPAGHLYVYFSYGVHWCANVVVARTGAAEAVLLRALAPLDGLDEMWAARPAARRPRDLCSGPGKLCQALAIDGAHDGADLVGVGGELQLLDDGTAPPARPGRGPRVGITLAAERPWRWWVPGDENISGGPGPRASYRRRAPVRAAPPRPARSAGAAEGPPRVPPGRR